ncbi:hypothetical protein ACFYYR_16545 [Streptomyces sp. NPDC001922]|uniref:hypothetical protein n=1 Tax=Streptomyces sp. NPDC001922 TaxID=3364624 RepID=UPI00368C8716
MTKRTTALVVGVTLGLMCTACTSGEEEQKRVPPPASPEPATLKRLPEISISGDPLAGRESGESPGTQRVLGEVYKGKARIIAYTEGDKCGVLVLNSGHKKDASINLITGWPDHRSEGSSNLPAGPYSTSSGADSEGTGRASLSCGKNAMVVQYSSDVPASVSRQRGSVTTAPSPGKKNFSVVVAPRGIRKSIVDDLPESF